MQKYQERKEFMLFCAEDLVDVCAFVEALLIKRRLEGIFPLVQTAIIELVMNGFKAYDKRDFFLQNGLNFVSDYNQGMVSFRRKFHEEQDKNEVILRKHPVHVELFISESNLKLIVETKIEMHYEEQKVVSSLLKQKANEDELIENEGGGMGILMILAILESLQFGRESFSFFTEPGRTIFSLALVFK